MKQIRRNIFETNSSSVHSLTICKREDYERWKTDGTYMYEDDEGVHFVSQDEAIERYNSLLPGYSPERMITKSMSDEEIEWQLKGWDMFTYDSWCEYCAGLSRYEEYASTEHGDRIVAFGYYGHD